MRPGPKAGSNLGSAGGAVAVHCGFNEARPEGRE